MFSNIFSKQGNEPVESRSEYNDHQSVIENFVSYMIPMEHTKLTITKEQLTASYLSSKYEDVNILTEGTSDFFASVNEFFKNMIQKIKEFFSRVLMNINKHLIKTDAFIKKYKNEIEAANPNFTIMGYQYTDNESFPKVDLVKRLVSNYNSELHGLRDKKKSDLVEERTEKVSANYLDSLRGEVIGVSEPLTNEQLSSMIKKLLRNGKNEKESIQINKPTYLSYVSSYENVKKSLASVKKDQKNIITLLEDLKMFFKTGASQVGSAGKYAYRGRVISAEDNKMKREDDYEDFESSSDVIEKVTTFYNHKWLEATELSSIVTTTLSLKVDALKEQLTFIESVVYGGLKKSNEGGE